MDHVKEQPLGVGRLHLRFLPLFPALVFLAAMSSGFLYYTLTEPSAGVKPIPRESAKKGEPELKVVKLALRDTHFINAEQRVLLPLVVEQSASPEKPAKATKDVPNGLGKQEKMWTVQVNAFSQEKSAIDFAKRLRDKGYDVYLVLAHVKGRTWYRVRVGRLDTREKAKELQEELKKKEKYTRTWIVLQTFFNPPGFSP